MAAKVALAALISVGLVIVSVATASAVRLESSANRAVAAAGTGDPGGARLECAGAVSSANYMWNTASWLVGLSLVWAISRRTPAQATA